MYENYKEILTIYRTFIRKYRQDRIWKSAVLSKTIQEVIDSWKNK